MVLKTKRLTLEPLMLKHAPDIQRHIADHDIIRWTPNIPWPYPANGAEEFIQRVLKRSPGTSYIWSIQLNTNLGETIGVIDYQKRDETDQFARGFWLAKPLWGKGLMTEVVSATNEYMFKEIGIGSIRATAIVGNMGSIRVKEKTGAVLVGTEEKDGIAYEIWITHNPYLARSLAL